MAGWSQLSQYPESMRTNRNTEISSRVQQYHPSPESGRRAVGSPFVGHSYCQPLMDGDRRGPTPGSMENFLALHAARPPCIWAEHPMGPWEWAAPRTLATAVKGSLLLRCNRNKLTFLESFCRSFISFKLPH